MGVRFITITKFIAHATAEVPSAEKGEKVVITKKGLPVALLKKVSRTNKGKSETVSNLKNNAIAMIEAVEKGKSFIITRDKKPVAVLEKVTDSAFRIVGK